MGAAQCGLCTPGMLLSAKSLLERNPVPNEAEIRNAISGNLSDARIVKIVKAITTAAAVMRGEARVIALAPAVPANTVESRKSTPPSGVGYPRLQGLGHVTGSTRYTDDLTLPGMLHAHPLYSTPRSRSYCRCRHERCARFAWRRRCGLSAPTCRKIVRALPSRTSRLLPTKSPPSWGYRRIRCRDRSRNRTRSGIAHCSPIRNVACRVGSGRGARG